ncbi:POU domain class 6 transcription factor 2 [Biomphalaria pfeifferi]|uniref:POU domain class 6 transcription factor 2 n=1 Tax=Biomphalaria pfeifferi TaxID=112525 RepID=A0AAD8C3J0_BIOPF|nr:POU domain class 6 transcription factor 2 [Biomphalaria pfeifferi]
MKPDMSQLLLADQELIAIFILLICLINGALLITQVKKPMFYDSVKLMMIISLAIGDIIFALFPLVVLAIQYSEADLTFMTCRLITIVTTYMSYLIHFVYGLGLVVLAAEVFLRNRIQSIHENNYKIISAVGASSVPWILGLIIILPLCMSNVNYESQCTNSQSLEFMFGVSVFLPVLLSIVISIVLNCVHGPTLQQGQIISTDQQPLIVSEQTVIQQENIIQYPPQRYAPGNTHYNSINSNPCPQNAVPYPPYPYPANQQVMSQSSTVNLNQGTHTIRETPMHQHAEGQRLLLISIIFGFMVVPIALITIRAAHIDWDDSMKKTVVTQFVFWLMVARSCITPLIMISFSNL